MELLPPAPTPVMPHPGGGAHSPACALTGNPMEPLASGAWSARSHGAALAGHAFLYA